MIKVLACFLAHRHRIGVRPIAVMYAIRKARFSVTAAESSALTPLPAPVLELLSWQLISKLEG